MTTTLSTTVTDLLAAVDRHPADWTVLGMLADALADEGDPREAGVRALISGRWWPLRCDDSGNWCYGTEGNNSDRWADQLKPQPKGKGYVGTYLSLGYFLLPKDWFESTTGRRCDYGWWVFGQPVSWLLERTATAFTRLPADRQQEIIGQYCRV